MDWSEEDQKVAVSAASAMSLKRSISSLDLAADARAARARRSAQPSNKEGLEDPTLETPLKDTGLPPSPDKTSPILNDLGPVALPRIGKKEGFYYSELYPHCGCDPAKDRVAMLDTPFAMLE